jgi:tetratricopeptide (TPR) repeat protein
MQWYSAGRAEAKGTTPPTKQRPENEARRRQKRRNQANQRQVNQIIGDAYYKIGKYDEASVYLENYTKSQKTTRTEDYQLGYSYFKSGNYDKAIKLFDKVAQTKDDMGQMALYHIGEVYMKKGDRMNAHRACANALELLYASDSSINIYLYKDYVYYFPKEERTASFIKKNKKRDTKKKHKAFDEYNLFDPTKGRYAIGYQHSVWELFNNSYSSEYEYIDLLPLECK